MYWWLFWGNLAFGFSVGLFTGLSKTPVVSGLMPLLFTFAGGSVVALSVADRRSAAELDLLGQELFGFGLGAVVGVLIGARLKAGGVAAVESVPGEKAKGGHS